MKTKFIHFGSALFAAQVESSAKNNEPRYLYHYTGERGWRVTEELPPEVTDYYYLIEGMKYKRVQL